MREPFSERVLDVIEEYAPNIRSLIIDRRTLTPLDLERRFGLTGGNIFHGEMSLDQMYSMRPVAHCATPTGTTCASHFPSECWT